MNLKKFWNECKYDFYSGMLIVIFWMLMSSKYDFAVWHLEYWIAVGFSVAFRFIGYKEGKYTAMNTPTQCTTRLDVNVKDMKIEPVICELKDIPNGLYFSLLSDKSQCKYMRCGEDVKGCITCWNSNTDKISLVNNDSKCVIYKTEMIHIPVIKVKEDK